MNDAAGGAVTRVLERVSRVAVWIAGGMMLGTVGWYPPRWFCGNC